MDLEKRRHEILGDLVKLGRERNKLAETGAVEEITKVKNIIRMQQQALSIVDACILKPAAAAIALPELFAEK